MKDKKTDQMFDDDDLDQVKDPSQPPQLVDELTKVAAVFMNKNYNNLDLCNRVPKEPREIAKWWATIEREPDHHEACRKKTKHRLGGSYWYCPYIDYCKNTLMKFLHQTPEFQSAIINANINGCYWRGHDQEDFSEILSEHVRMLEIGVDDYRKEAKTRLKDLIFKPTRRQTKAVKSDQEQVA